MKSVEELKAIKAKMQDKVALRKTSGEIRVVVGMGTCGIAAGAKPVLNAFVEGVAEAGLYYNVSVTQSGYIGDANNAPVVEVYAKGVKTTYVKMTESKAKEVLEKHIKGGTPVAEYTAKK